MDYLLDASAVLALLQREPGSERVEKLLPNAGITSVNVCEVLGVLARNGFSTTEALTIFDKLHIPVLPFTYAQAQWAADLFRRRVCRRLSLGDRACIGAAIESNKKVLTAERSWSDLDLRDVSIESIR